MLDLGLSCSVLSYLPRDWVVGLRRAGLSWFYVYPNTLLRYITHMYIHTSGRTPDSPKIGEKIDPMQLPNRGLANLISTWLEEQRRAFCVAEV